MIDLQNLRAMTQESIRLANIEREAALAREREEAARVRKMDEMKAEQILGQVPNRCATEARAGRSFAIVMSLRYGDFEGGSYSVYGLKGAGRIVFEKLNQSGIPTKLEAWDNGAGTDGGYNLVVSW